MGIFILNFFEGRKLKRIQKKVDFELNLRKVRNECRS